jgi:hypothetical protein
MDGMRAGRNSGPGVDVIVRDASDDRRAVVDRIPERGRRQTVASYVMGSHPNGGRDIGAVNRSGHCDVGCGG